MFQIYAKGRNVGERISDQDNIAFYAPFSIQTVDFHKQGHVFTKCMMQASNHVLPINDVAFDKCASGSVEITIFD